MSNKIEHLTTSASQDGENLILRQSGALASGERQHVYAADMRREVSLQFYPDGFEWLDNDPIPLSLGYSSHSVRGATINPIQGMCFSSFAVGNGVVPKTNDIVSLLCMIHRDGKAAS